jgi:hypothetical protein
MASFLTFVLFQSDPKDAQAMVTGLLAAYSKSLEVAEYEAKCPCVHAQVEAKARELAEKQVKASDKVGPSPFERVTETALALQDAQQAAIQDLLDKAVPDPNCKDCGGSGNIRTTSNPNGKWTSWEMGGGASDNVLAAHLTDDVDDPNSAPVKMLNLDDLPLPWAIITPDGKWHAAGEPYWFGTSRVDDRDWENTVRKIMEQNADATLVLVECQS